MIDYNGSSAVSKLRRPFLSNRYFFITVRRLQPLRFDHRPRENALRPPHVNLIDRTPNEKLPVVELVFTEGVVDVS